MKRFELTVKFTIADKDLEQINRNLKYYTVAAESDKERLVKIAKLLQEPVTEITSVTVNAVKEEEIE